jgi:hypothetical protein
LKVRKIYLAARTAVKTSHKERGGTMKVFMPNLTRKEQRRLWDLCVNLLNAYERASQEIPGRNRYFRPSKEATEEGLMVFAFQMLNAAHRFKRGFYNKKFFRWLCVDPADKKRHSKDLLMREFGSDSEDD